MEIRDAKEKDIEKINEIYNKAIKNLTVTFETDPLSLWEQTKWSKWSEKKCYKYKVDNSVYLDSKCRNKGIGKKLLEKLISKSQKR